MSRTKRKLNPVIPAPQDITKQRIYHAAGYARLSVEDGGKPGADTLEVQQRLISDFIAEQSDMQFCGLFSDNGKTGTNFERPSFERLMGEVRTGRVDCIVVKDLSRFGRNYLETGEYLERVFPFLGVRFIAINDSFDTLTAERGSDGYIVPLKNIINAAYSKDISRKTITSFAGKQQRGEFIGSWASYGYRKCADDPHRIEPDEINVPVVRKIFAWRASGLSYRRIANILNELAIPSPSHYLYMCGYVNTEKFAATRWNPPGVKHLLHNGVYLGNMIQGRRRSSLSEGLNLKPVPVEEWTVVHGTHEPLIDEETFRIVQLMSEQCKEKSRAQSGKNDNYGSTPNILRGLVFCADCHHPMVRHKVVYGKNLHYIWLCQTHEDDPAACPKKKMYDAQLQSVLWTTIQKECLLASDMDSAIKRHRGSKAVRERECELERAEAEAAQALDKADMHYESLYANYVDHLLTEHEYMEMKAQYREEISVLRERLSCIQTQRESTAAQCVKNPWIEVFERFRGEKELTKEMARALVERIEIDAECVIHITLRYKDAYRDLLTVLAGGETA